MQNNEVTRLDQLIADYCQLHLDSLFQPVDPERERLMETIAAEIGELLRSNAPAENAPAVAVPSAEPYAGYTNYETAQVIITLGNNGHTDETARAIVATAWWNAADEIIADRDASVAPEADAADALRDWLRDEENPLADTASLYSDLLEHVLNRVNWREVAEHFQPDPLPSLEPLPDPDDDEEQEGPEPEWWRSERERED